MALLEIKGLTKYYGALAALDDVSFDIKPGQIMGLIGPNGSGKSTLINVVTGIYKPTRGKVFFKGKDVTGYSPHKLAEVGISRSFQLTNLFREFTVMGAMCISFHLHTGIGFWGTAFRTPSTRKKEADIEKKAMNLLEFLGLDNVKNEIGKNLPHGFQRWLGVGMTLATGAELVMLDEPVTGMNPKEIIEMMEMIRKVRDRGTTVLIVEHNMRVIMNLCDRIVVINFGKKICEGTAKEIQENKDVIEAYLGVEEEP